MGSQDVRARADERLGCLLAAVAAAAVDEDELVGVGQRTRGILGNRVVGQQHGAGDVFLVVLGLRANVEDHVAVLGIHDLLRALGIDLLVGCGG